jgi:hypothetical protein
VEEQVTLREAELEDQKARLRMAFDERKEIDRQHITNLDNALRALISSADDVLMGYDATRRLKKPGYGMGYNIAVETSAKYSSITYWERVRKTIKQAREVRGA